MKRNEAEHRRNTNVTLKLGWGAYTIRLWTWKWRAPVFSWLKVYRTARRSLRQIFTVTPHALTPEYLAFDFYYRICHKKFVTKTLFTRVDCLPLTCGCMAIERKYVPGVLKVDGYSRNCLKHTSGDEGSHKAIKRKFAPKPFANAVICDLFAKLKDPIPKEQFYNRCCVIYSL